jgi:hypothetical protein
MNIEKEIEKILSKNTMQDTAYTLNSGGLKRELNQLIQKALTDQKKEIRDWIDRYHPNQCTAVKDIKNYLKD